MGKNPIPDPQHWLTFLPYFTHSPLPHGGEEENAGLNLLALPAGGERGVVQVLDAVPRLLLGYVALRRGLALHNAKQNGSRQSIWCDQHASKKGKSLTK